jgi:hypothetical protein
MTWPAVRRTAVVAAGVALVAAGAGVAAPLRWPTVSLVAQVRDPSRTNPASAAAGTAEISGVVTEEAGHQPLRRATVTISGGQLLPRVMTTDDAGHFQITGLPVGAYTATVSKPGYVTTYVGSRRPGRSPGIPFTVANGERHELAVSLTRGAVISGIITDPFGQPVPNVRVSVGEYRVMAGERRLISAQSNGPNSVQTDERGAFRVWGLPGGTYVISVSPVNLPANTSIRQITTADLDWARDQLAAGRSGTANTPAPDAGHAVGYTAVYFPGVVDASAAAQLVVGPGEEHGGVNFSLLLVPTSTVEGSVIGIDGQPAVTGVQVTLTQVQRSTSESYVFGPTFSRGTSVDRTGKFTLAGVPPGQYTLTARASSRAPLPPPSVSSVGGVPPGAPPPPPPPPAPISVLSQDLWASLDVGVSGDDLKGVTLALRPGMTFAGRVVFEGTSAPVTDMTHVRVGLNPMTNDGIAFNVPQRAIAANGTFTLTGVTPGRYRPITSILNPPSQPGAPPAPSGQSPWRLKSALWQGRDLLDLPLEIHPDENISGVTLVFSDVQSEISGSLTTGAGTPALGYVVVAFTTDASLWPTNSRRVRSANPQPDGTYKITGLPAGSYYLGALTDVDFNDLSDPSFLEQLAAASLKITLTDGGKIVQNLRLK